MAELLVTFPFTSTAEGFVGTPGTSSTLTHSAGTLSSTTSGRNVNTTSYWEWTGTWEALGVPVGATITQIRLGGHNYQCTVFNTGRNNTQDGPIELRDSAGTTIIATLWAGVIFTATHASMQVVGAQPDQAVGALYQASNTTIRLRINVNTSTANSASAEVTLLDDNLSLTVTYTEAATEVNLTIANGSSSHSAAVLGLTSEANLGVDSSSHSSAAGTPALTISDTVHDVSDTNWFFSPGNWYKSGTSYALTNNTGAYVKVRFNGTGLTLGIDLSVWQAAGQAADRWPFLSWSLDGGAIQHQQTASGQTSQVIATGLSAGEHTAQIWFRSITPGSTDRWNTPTAQVRFTSLTVTAGSLLSPTLRTKRWMAFGDSITEGTNANGDTYLAGINDATRTYAQQVAEALDAEIGTVGFVSQGYMTTPNPAHNITFFHQTGGAQTWPYQFLGQNRDFSGIDAVLIVQGTNDVITSQDAETLESHIEDFLTDFRALYSGIDIYLVAPFSGTMRETWQAAFSDYQTVTPDNKCFLVDISQDDATLQDQLSGTIGVYAYDGLHPSQAGHDRLAELLEPAITNASAPTLVAVSTSHGMTSEEPTLTQVQPLGVDSTALAQTSGELALGEPATTIYVYWAEMAFSTSLDATLNPLGADHNHIAGTLSLTQEHTLSVDSSTSGQAAGAVALGQAQVVTLEDAVHAHAVGGLELEQAHALALDAAAHAHTADEAAFSQQQVLDFDSTFHVESVAEVTVTQQQVLDIGGATSGHTADVLEMNTAAQLGVDAASSAHAVIDAALTQAQQITVADTAHNHSVDNPSLGQVQGLTFLSADHGHMSADVALTLVSTEVTLGILNAASGQTVDGVDLTQTQVVGIEDTAHAHAAGTLDFSGAVTLSTASGRSVHRADTLLLDQDQQLAVTNAAHAAAVDNLSLTQYQVLEITSATSGQTSGTLSLDGSVVLGIGSASIGQSAEAASVTQAQIIGVDAATHATTAGTATVTQAQSLGAEGSTSGHNVSTLALDLNIALAILHGKSGQSADDLLLTQAQTLEAGDTTHGLLAEALALYSEGELLFGDTTHAHNAGNPAVTQVHTLGILSASHLTATDALALEATTTLEVAQSTHGHLVGEINLEQVHVLGIDDTVLEHAAGTVNFFSKGRGAFAQSFVGGSF